MNTDHKNVVPALSSNILCDRVVLITGATGGLGSAMSRACTQAGATVVLLGKRVPALEKLYDELIALNKATPAIYPLDLAGAGTVHYQELAQVIAQQCGRLDGIFHAAVNFSGLETLTQQSLEDWMRTMHVNVTAPWMLTQACWPLMSQQKDASVIFVLDALPEQQMAYWGAYGASQAALHQLMHTWHAETESSVVRVHGLLPGAMRTRLRAQAFLAENPESVPTPEHAADAGIYLLSAQAQMLRGQIFKL